MVAAARIEPVGSWQSPRSVSALRATRSRAVAGSRREATQSFQGCSAAACRSCTGSRCGSRLCVPKRSSSTTWPPAADRSTTAFAVSYPASFVTSHSTPGECSATGSLEPSTSRPSSSGWSCTATWPNSGRGANSTRARPVPLSTRTSVESPLTTAGSSGVVSRTGRSSQSVTVRPDQRVSTVIVLLR